MGIIKWEKWLVKKWSHNQIDGDWYYVDEIWFKNRKDLSDCIELITKLREIIL